MKYNAPDMIPPARMKNQTSGRHRRLGDRIFSNLTLVFALVIVGILLGLVIVLNIDAAPAISKFGLSFLSSTSWDPVKESFGALPAIYGTLLSSAIGVIIAMPISLGAAIFLVEMAPSWLRGTLLLSHRNAGGYTQRNHRAVGDICSGAVHQSRLRPGWEAI